MSDLVTLPDWCEPNDLDEAKTEILNLGRSMHEHAYLVGKVTNRMTKQVSINVV